MYTHTSTHTHIYSLFLSVHVFLFFFLLWGSWIASDELIDGWEETTLYDKAPDLPGQGEAVLPEARWPCRADAACLRHPLALRVPSGDTQWLVYKAESGQIWGTRPKPFPLRLPFPWEEFKPTVYSWNRKCYRHPSPSCLLTQCSALARSLGPESVQHPDGLEQYLCFQLSSLRMPVSPQVLPQ